MQRPCTSESDPQLMQMVDGFGGVQPWRQRKVDLGGVGASWHSRQPSGHGKHELSVNRRKVGEKPLQGQEQSVEGPLEPSSGVAAISLPHALKVSQLTWST